MRPKQTIGIKEIKGQKVVLVGRKHVGYLNKFCCGIDFRPKGNKNALFSILGVRYGERRLIKCINALLSIKIPNSHFHWNFNYDIAISEDRLKERG